MIRTLLRFALTALSIGLIIPFLVKGIQFHGTVLGAAGLGLAFTAAYFALGAAIGVGFKAIAGNTDSANRFIPLWILLFWLFAGALLQLVAHVAPALLSVDGWLSAMGGGLILLVVGMATAGFGRASGRCSSGSCSSGNCSKGSCPNASCGGEKGTCSCKR